MMSATTNHRSDDVESASDEAPPMLKSDGVRERKEQVYAKVCKGECVRVSGAYLGGGGGYADSFGTMNRLQAYDHHNHCNNIEALVGSDQAVMMEEESRIDKEGTVGSSSKDTAKEERDDGGWLRLGIGSHSHEAKTDEDQTPRLRSEPGPIELELMPSSSSTNYRNMPASSIPPQSQNIRLPEFRTPRTLMSFASGPGFSLLQNTANASSSGLAPQYQETSSWTNRNINPINTAAASISILSSSPSLPLPPVMPLGPYVSRPLQRHTGVAAGGVDITQRPAIDFRVIQPPRRPSSGLWLMLQASQNQEREPFLPQLSKRYLRIRDGRMTIRLVIKYLVIKLRLESENEKWDYGQFRVNATSKSNVLP
ncbi:RING finger protein [Dorcoceras hygrometricum]|uniref:RING finger protein n=1 Tax=Dorcoceras hygrometricum TaxID=472368 RepID=A0A2Z7CH17_9LAMI|nr:RING finger protein [Dorcoceras hygrometricum]